MLEVFQSLTEDATMAEALRAVRAAARLELEQLSRSRVLVALVVLEAITFLVLVSLFGLTGQPRADRADRPRRRSARAVVRPITSTRPITPSRCGR